VARDGGAAGVIVVNFGLEGLVPAFLYATAIAVFLLSVFWRPIVGIYYFVPLIPLQTIRYRLNDLPLGSSLVYIILLGVALGLLRQGRWILPRTPWTTLFSIYIVFTFVSMCLGSIYLGSAMPWAAEDGRLSDWADYITMPLTFFLVSASVSNPRQIKILLLLMCVSTLMLDRSFWNTVSGHDFSTFNDDLREGGTMGYAGSNGLATFEAQMATFLAAMAFSDRQRIKRFAYLGLAAFCVVCLLYSLSRGGYIACAVGLVFVGVVKARKLLLVLAVFAATWTSLVPKAVISRVDMTYDESGQLDESSQTRVTLWEDALQLLSSNPLLGTGFDTYRFMKRVREYEDTHNIYLKILVETGVAGLFLFFAILFTTFYRSILLFRHATDPIATGIGLGLAGWVLCALVACFFGDRWTYLQIQGWFWVLAAFVGLCWSFEQQAQTPAASDSESEDARLEAAAQPA
jgi:putative inorganic carbon (HCO3(-)) transporter